MNENFKSILAKAHMQLADQGGLPLDTMMLAERFATLVVYECAAVADQCREDEWFDVSSAIKEHFGVK